MNDKEIFSRILEEPERPIEFKSLEMILAEYPILDLENPALFQIYKNFNKSHLTEEENLQIDSIILKLRIKQSNIDKKNIAYLERHLKEGVKPLTINEIPEENPKLERA
tara:strand:+ start:167 stop:493 length:327 start_codon:yes stop_codon:yes gene_type:complete